jgi:hypothetical protein
MQRLFPRQATVVSAEAVLQAFARREALHRPGILKGGFLWQQTRYASVSLAPMPITGFAQDTCNLVPQSYPSKKVNLLGQHIAVLLAL